MSLTLGRVHVAVGSAGQRVCRSVSDGGPADDAAAADGGRPAVAGRRGEPHGNRKLLIIHTFTHNDPNL